MSSRGDLGSDKERVSEGVLEGMRYSFSPPKGNNLDQRMSFFTRFPHVVLVEHMLKYLPKEQAKTLSSKVHKRLSSLRLTNRHEDNLTKPQRKNNFQSLLKFKEGDKGCTDRRLERWGVIGQLSDIAEKDDKGLGLLDYLEILIKEQDESVRHFVVFHIGKRILTERSREGDRKSNEVSSDLVHEDGKAIVYDEASTTEEVTEDGVSVYNSSKKHFNNRKRTFAERLSIAEAAKEYATKSLSDTMHLVDVLIERMDKNADASIGKSTVSASDRLDFILPAAMGSFMEVAMRQVDNVVAPENAKVNDAEGMVYRSGRSAISWKNDGTNNLSSLVDKASLGKSLSEIRIAKEAIYKEMIKPESESINKIAKSVNQFLESKVSREFVKYSIRQMKLLQIPLQCWPYVYNEFAPELFKHMDKGGKSPAQALRIVNIGRIKRKFPKAKPIEVSRFLDGFEIKGIAESFRSSIIPQDCLAELIADPKKVAQKNRQLKEEGRTSEDMSDKEAKELRKDDPVITSLREYYDPVAVKNGFCWRWSKILEILYEPETPLQTIDGETESNDWYIGSNHITDKKAGEKFSGRRRYNRAMFSDDREKIDPLDRVGHMKVNVSRKLRRRYHDLQKEIPEAFGCLISILTAHAYIVKGTIPNKVYDRTGSGNHQPGSAWGHNCNRSTHETNTRMFYDIFHGGLDRDNPDHAKVRSRCAEIERIKRSRNSKLKCK